MTVNLAELIKKAGEVAKLVPDHLQEAAFNRAYETLLAEQQSGSRDTRTAKVAPRPRTTTPKQKAAPAAGELASLDRTAHPEISHTGRPLDNALRLLRAAKDDLGIDGLSASALSKVLVDKFRCRLTRRGVSQALNDAGRYVNRHTEGKVVIFRLMGPGEDYLDSLAEGDQPRPEPASTPKRRAKRAQAKVASTPSKARRAAPKKTTGRVGPAVAMDQLHATGFFGSPQSISAIIAKLQHDQGRTFRQNELSPQLLRWLRSGKLSRTKNTDGQYEYFVK